MLALSPTREFLGETGGEMPRMRPQMLRIGDKQARSKEGGG